MSECIIEKREYFLETMSFRVSDRLKNKVITMSKMYADGDTSAWIRHCLENYNPKVVKKKGRKPKGNRP